jgi:uncharacterized membrane protein
MSDDPTPDDPTPDDLTPEDPTPEPVEPAPADGPRLAAAPTNVDRYTDEAPDRRSPDAATASVARPAPEQHIVVPRSELPAPWGSTYIKLRHRLATLPTVGALVGAFVLWWPSLRPTLLPRSWLLQGAAGAVCATAGYCLAGLLTRIGRSIAQRQGWTMSQRTTRIVHIVLGVAAVVVVVVGSWRWYAWQRDQAPLVTLDPPSAGTIVPMLITTVVLFALLVTIGRLLRHFVAFLDRSVGRILPQKIARIGVVAVALMIGSVAIGFATRSFTNWSDTNFGTFDTTTPDGVTQPEVSSVSGGNGSLVKWDDLGYQGRAFIGGVPSAADIRSFRDTGAVKDPIRVYVGLQSADSTDARVALAVKELERTGAFDRKVLLVTTPTGTGWVNPDAARTLEYMYGGDTAIVGVQYSFLPSWIAFLLDTKSPRVLGEALFKGVHDAWAKLPADHRPLLVAYGESLGSLGGEQAFATSDLHSSLGNITSQTDATLFVGPTRGNPIFGGAIDHRDAGSKSWQPKLAAEPNVRFANNIADITATSTAWPSPRVLYLHHPSDAIGTWQWSNIWSNPGWSANPPPYDVPSAATWTPFVTFVQETFDLMNGFSAAPGYGHDYRNAFVNAWAALVPPKGWTEANSQSLLAFLNL